MRNPTTKAKSPNAEQNPTERLWTVDDAAYYLQVPVQTLYYWRQTGRGPRSYRIGREVRYIPTEVQAYVQDCLSSRLAS